MKKKYLLMAFFASALLSVSCSDDNNSDGGGTEVKTPETEISDFNNKYNVTLRALTSTATDSLAYAANGDVKVPSAYTVATTAQTLEVVKFLESEIFPVFGEDFIASVMPRKIFVADEVYFTSYYETTTDLNPDYQGDGRRMGV